MESAATPDESPRPAEPAISTPDATPGASPPCGNQPSAAGPAPSNEPGAATGAADEPADEGPSMERWEARRRRPDPKELARKAKQARKGR